MMDKLEPIGYLKILTDDGGDRFIELNKDSRSTQIDSMTGHHKEQWVYSKEDVDKHIQSQTKALELAEKRIEAAVSLLEFVKPVMEDGDCYCPDDCVPHEFLAAYKQFINALPSKENNDAEED